MEKTCLEGGNLKYFTISREIFYYLFPLNSRFTEENFACLIAFIFIKKAIDKVIHISDHSPIHESPCYCKPENDTYAELYPMQMDFIGKI